jgi:hypothetical protein
MGYIHYYNYMPKKSNPLKKSNIFLINKNDALATHLIKKESIYLMYEKKEREHNKKMWGSFVFLNDNYTPNKLNTKKYTHKYIFIPIYTSLRISFTFPSNIS